MIFMDAHVIIHKCFNLNTFMDAALANFKAAAGRFRGPGENERVLVLAEPEGMNWFERLSGYADRYINPWIDRWEIKKTGDPEALRLVHATEEHLFLVAGRRIITREKVEILALFTLETFADRKPASDLVKAILENGAIPVIPWSPGRWREKEVRRLLEAAPAGSLFLGDAPDDPGLGGLPVLLKTPEEKGGIRVLAGTNPGPIRSEQKRPGSFGTAIFEKLNVVNPSRHLKSLLKNPETRVERYGKRMSALESFGKRTALRFRKK